MVNTQSNTRTCRGRHLMADSSLTDPSRITYPAQLWTNPQVLTQCITSATNTMGWVGPQRSCARSALTESICMQSSTPGRQTGCTSAHQWCSGSNTEDEHQAYYTEVTQTSQMFSIQKLPVRNRGGPKTVSLNLAGLVSLRGCTGSKKIKLY